MSLLPFRDLPIHTARRVVPLNIDLGRWEELEPIYDGLARRLKIITTTEELTKWLIDFGELSAVLDEEGARRYIAMTCHTDNPEAQKAYLSFIENVEPPTKPRRFALEKAYLEHPAHRKASPDDTLFVFDRDVEVGVKIFRDENVPLETDESRLAQSYSQLMGGLTVEYDGKERTLQAMGVYQENTSRAVREQAWRVTVDKRFAVRDDVNKIFGELLPLRGKLAQNAGFADYRDYAFQMRRRFDYGVKESLAFHQAVESEVMPVLCGLQKARQAKMGLAQLRPWDLAVNPAGLPGLKPFEGASQLVEKSSRVFQQLDGELGDWFQVLVRHQLLDLQNRKGKAPGGYQYTLSESRMPFIFMNAVGLQRDVETLLHEGGHAFHALAAREEPLLAYRSAPIEFCEVASMSMELLGNDFLEEFYSHEDAVRARRDHLEGVVATLPWIAVIDSFQHWLYTHPGHSLDERTAEWMRILNRFGGIVDWTGLESYREIMWQRQPHLFGNPFYYIEYGIAQLGALQIWVNSKKNRAEAVRQYKDGLRLGGSKTLPELFAASGCRFDFTAATIRPLMQQVQEELARLGV